jgi:hypothetical protein
MMKTYRTELTSDDEVAFQRWILAQDLPWLDIANSDYDMRGFWKAMQAGDPGATRAANGHFPDTWKTPYHETFSNESIYATPDAPRWELVRPKRKKGVYIGAPACFALEQCCQHINEALGDFGCYLVGSALERADWRDVDVRYIMTDEQFAKLFPDAGQHWEHNPRWLLLTVSISGWMRSVTGLPVDFQIQPQSHANERHKGQRSALGLKIAGGK